MPAESYFIVANSFAAPFCSDQSFDYQDGADPVSALEAFAVRYGHPFGLYAAAAYRSADDYHRKESPLALWLSNQARAGRERVSDPKAGRAEATHAG